MKLTKPRKRCIFCEGASGTSISKEHVLPDWLRELFPRSPSDTHTMGVVNWVELETGGLAPATSTHTRQGQASTRKVRFVCEKCNHGWLSTMEERTKPLLKRLVVGDRTYLSIIEQSALATWAVKTVMTAEFIEPTKSMVPQDHHTFLMETQSPPAGWSIWIAGNGGTRWATGIRHFSAQLNLLVIDEAENKVADHQVYDIQSTTIGIGRLLIHSISCPPPGNMYALSHPDKSDLKPIWPLTGNTLYWPPTRYLNDDDVDIISTNLERSAEVRASMEGFTPPTVSRVTPVA